MLLLLLIYLSQCNQMMDWFKLLNRVQEQAGAGENENWYLHQQRMAGLAFFSRSSILLMLTAIIYIMQMVLIIPG